jgi:hypothetical protein
MPDRDPTGIFVAVRRGFARKEFYKKPALNTPFAEFWLQPQSPGKKDLREVDILIVLVDWGRGPEPILT